MITLSCKPSLVIGDNPSRPHLLLKTHVGFTIIELLVAVGILGIVAGVGVQMFLMVAKSFGKAQVISELQQEGTRVVNEISRVIRDSEKVEEVRAAECASVNGLKITLNKDALEYLNNGNCQVVIYCLMMTDATHNNYLQKTLEDCNFSPVGAGEITHSNRATGVDVDSTTLIFSLGGGGAQPYLVDINLKLRQGLDVPQREVYQAEVEIKNSVASRNF